MLNWTDILDGAIANAAWGVVSMAAKPRTSQQVATDLDTAAWADTERLIADTLAEIVTSKGIPDLSEHGVAALEATLKRPEVQGALQALLAARITDAPETDAARAREAVRLALRVRKVLPGGAADRRAGASGNLRSTEPAGVLYAGRLSDYFDEKICSLVSTLEGQVGFAGLAQVRAEAYNARIVALLGAVERQVAALTDPARGGPAEAEFIVRYRRQAHQRHGFITPPDFDRRRRVAVADIYVPTEIIRVRETPFRDFADSLARRLGEVSLLRTQGDGEQDRATPLDYATWPGAAALAGLLDRTVLLGDPGGGKTTAANVLTDRLAGDPAGRIPFLVTLRDYAARTLIEWSVAECIEHNLRTVYQCPAPAGLVERLLLTGQAVVVFDGLDELLDTSRRRDVSDRVEQFCSAYPLTPVLVTSRVVGYDQARLDDAQFTCYRLGGFGHNQVAAYARKWFAAQDGMPPAEAQAKAEAFLAESANARDLRANPLLLSLMCILYRGAGSLPGDRAGIYARCAELLLRKWDEQRDLYQKLESDHLVEPTLRYLAWWLFTREDSGTAAAERELIAKATEFFVGRGYETEEQAMLAAREFVRFSSGRMWVFTDAGTSAAGEGLYSFTHRTFLEYFAACHLAATSDTPENLATTLAPQIGQWRGGWDSVGELAIQIKDRSSDRGADRIYEVLLKNVGKKTTLDFLIDCLQSARPSPGIVRAVTRAAVERAFSMTAESRYRHDSLERLLTNSDNYERAISDEISIRLDALVRSRNEAVRVECLLFALEACWLKRSYFWWQWSKQQADRHKALIYKEAISSPLLRTVALDASTITINEALAMPGGLSALLSINSDVSSPYRIPYPPKICQRLMDEPLDGRTISELKAVGQYLVDHPRMPWIRSARYPSRLLRTGVGDSGIRNASPALDEVSGLGFAALVAAAQELSESSHRTANLSALPMPAQFKQLFRDWEAKRVSFAQVLER